METAHNPDATLLKGNPEAPLVEFRGGGLNAAALEDRLNAAEDQAAALFEEMNGKLAEEQTGGGALVKDIPDVFLKNFGLLDTKIIGNKLNSAQVTNFITVFKDVNFAPKSDIPATNAAAAATNAAAAATNAAAAATNAAATNASPVTNAATTPAITSIKVSGDTTKINEDLKLIYDGMSSKTKNFTEFFFIFDKTDPYTKALMEYFNENNIKNITGWAKLSKESTRAKEIIQASSLSEEKKEEIIRTYYNIEAETPASASVIPSVNGAVPVVTAPAPAPAAASGTGATLPVTPSVNGATLPVNGATLPVNGATLPENGATLPVTTSGTGATLPVNGATLPVTTSGTGATLPVTTSGTGATPPENGATLPENGATLPVTTSGTGATPPVTPSVNGATLPVNGATPPATPSVNGATLPVNGATLPVNGATPPATPSENSPDIINYIVDQLSDIYDIDDIKKQLVKTTLLGVFSRIEKPINEEQIQHLKNIANDAARVLTIPNDEIKTLSQDDVNTLIYYFNEDQIKQLTPEQARNIPKNIIDTLVINNALAITNRASAPEPTEGGRRRTLGRRSRK